MQKGDLRAVLNITFKINIPEISDTKGRSKVLKSHKINMEIILDTQSDFIKFKINILLLILSLHFISGRLGDQVAFSVKLLKRVLY